MVRSKLSRFLEIMSKDYAFSITTVIIIMLLIILAAAYLSYSSSSHASTAVPKFEFTQYSRLKNLTYVDLYSFSTNKLVSQIPVVKVSSINVTLNRSSAAPGNRVHVGVIYNGTFNFNNYNVSAFLSNTINIYYYGFYPNGSDYMYVLGSEPNSTKYFKDTSDSQIVTPAGSSPSQELELVLNITPTANATGKVWYICGGVYITFKNESNWPTQFSSLTYSRSDVSNSTTLNMVSRKCSSMEVT
ncbi:MAG: hypothetical protein QXN59_00820 [Candidatus Micrarchaeaceae archaeon]